MDIFWICEICGATNNYRATTKCELCDENISPTAEGKCINQMADSLYDATTTDDFFNVADYCIKIEKYLCKEKAQKVIADEKSYLEAILHYNNALNLEKDKKWDKAEAEYGNAISLFDTVLSYKDSKTYLNKCKIAKQSAHNNHIYHCAKDALAKATTIDEYKAAGEIFLTLSGFSDAKDKYEFCINRIKEITIEQQYQTILSQKDNAIREKDLQKRSILLQDIIKTFEQYALSEKASVAVTEAKKLLSDCLAEIENQRIKRRYAEAKACFEKSLLIAVHKNRLSSFTAIVSEYSSDAKTDEFVELIKKCNKEIEEAKKEVAYNLAMELMRNADTEFSFSKAADAFEKILDFKDASKKAEECRLSAKECKYEQAVAELETNKKFFTLFGLKHKKS